MRFQRLRLSGFKSFVEPTEFRIEPGLTGVVGPNGCGKSNLLEAMRWVMGANSAKAMRAEGMDDVIFGGTSGRPARNHAEVRLEIDNSERRAPAQFNSHPVLEVVRRIERGAGSTYRVNGVETRARDVQLLFADASTGANSPALVRQGQISELIGAKPSNRRRILEEAAGISGLHSRRHEADLRLNAAEANLARLEDVTRELESALNRLKREARQADKYKKLASEIRALQGAALYARWAQAKDALQSAETELKAAEGAVETTTREAARSAAAAAKAGEALKPLREEAMVTAAVLQRLGIERDRLERDEAQAKGEIARIEAERDRNAADQAREAQIKQDAETVLARIARELAEIEAAISAAPERVPALEQALAEAERARAAADQALERLAAEAAAESARRKAALAQIEDAQTRLRAAEARVQAADARLARLGEALKGAEDERGKLGAGGSAQAASARGRLEAAEQALATARTALEAAEAERSDAAQAETATRECARRADDELRRLRAEAQGLLQIATVASKGGFAPALSEVSAYRGLEAALAAALGDDLDAALDARAPAYWGGAEAGPPAWPEGAVPLAPLVGAPQALTARLAFVALVDRNDGARLQGLIPPGARLVSREGDLWRWDGFTARAEAPKPAAKRLAQKARLTEIEAEIARLAPLTAEAVREHAAAGERLKQAEAALGAARRAPQLADRAIADARQSVEAYAREAARREARAQALDEMLARLEADLDEAQAVRDAAVREAEDARQALAAATDEAPQAQGPDPGAALAQARNAQAAARDAENRARAALDAERRGREGRQRRREALNREQTDWARRTASADQRSAELLKEREKIERALDAAREAPASLETRRLSLLDELAAAEARHALASDALAEAENERERTDRAAKTAYHAAAEAREARAAASARVQAAQERFEAAAGQVRQTAQVEPEVLAARIAEEAVAVPSDPAAVEAHLRALERERDLLGPVNLRADEEAQEHAKRLDSMCEERADLIGAIAKLRGGVEELNAEGRERLAAAFERINESFKSLFQTLFEGGQAELRLVESDDPLEAGLEIFACPPGKRLAAMSLMSGGEQALTATALIFAVFLANPAPVCVLDEVDAPLDDANVDRFCRMLDEMRRRTETRFIVITHNPVTMSRMDRLFGVTMAERGVSHLVSVDLRQAEAMAAE